MEKNELQNKYLGILIQGQSKKILNKKKQNECD